MSGASGSGNINGDDTDKCREQQHYKTHSLKDINSEGY